MYTWFTRLLNMSLTAGLLVGVILLLRLGLKKAPKKYLCVLWALVALRLLLPFSIPSSFSALNLLPVDTDSAGQVEVFQYNGKTEKPELLFEVPTLLESPSSAAGSPIASRTSDLYLPTVMNFWAAGVLTMLAYGIISTAQLRKTVSASIPEQDRVYLCDDIPTAFILGVFRPRIYLPSGLTETTKAHVLAHERAHLQRRDHWWKPLGYLLLSIHWFNPMLWMAYLLLCRDIEAACDEKVIADMGSEGKAAYAEALLSCATQRRRITACPVAFGETDVKGRVKNIMNYKKPGFWLVCVAVIACVGVGVFFLTGPKGAHTPENASVLVAEITRIQGDTLTVRPVEGSPELNSSDAFTIGNFTQYVLDGMSYEVGDVIRIAYNGEILETYPATLGEIYHIGNPVLIETVWEEIIYVDKIPLNDFTKKIPFPSTGTAYYVIDNSAHGSYTAFWNHISMAASADYVSQLEQVGYVPFAQSDDGDFCGWLLQKEDVVLSISSTEGELAVQINMPASLANDAAVPPPECYTLTIGEDGVARLDINLRGQLCHYWESKNGETLNKGEKIDLVALKGVTDLRGLEIDAFNAAGEIIFMLNIPELPDNADMDSWEMDDWSLVSVR